MIAVLESSEDHEAFEAAVIADYNAETAFEPQPALRLASVFWRLRRATSIETAIFDSTIRIPVYSYALPRSGLDAGRQITA